MKKTKAKGKGRTKPQPVTPGQALTVAMLENFAAMALQPSEVTLPEPSLPKHTAYMRPADVR